MVVKTLRTLLEACFENNFGTVTSVVWKLHLDLEGLNWSLFCDGRHEA